MIPSLAEIARALGVDDSYVTLAAAAALTGAALCAHAVANWFDDTSSEKKS